MDNTNIIKGTLTNGFEFEFDRDNLDNWKFIEMPDKLNKNPSELEEAFVLILGENQFERLKKYEEEKEGKIRITSMLSCFEELMSIDFTKN